MKKLIVLILAITTYTQVFAQQDPQYTMYMFNQLALNPAYAGSRECLSSTLHYRNQWTGIEGAPKTLSFGIHSPIGAERAALGLQVINDKIGANTFTNVAGSYAYRIPVTKHSKLSLGLQAVLQNYGTDVSKLNPKNSGDAIINNNITNVLLPNFGAGAYYYSEKYYVGITMPHIINNKLQNKTNIASTSDNAKQYRHLFLMAGKIFDINKAVKFKPSGIMKLAANSPLEIDLNASFMFMDALTLGASWRSDFSPYRNYLTESVDLNGNLRNWKRNESWRCIRY